jgi:hypothetical protein
MTYNDLSVFQYQQIMNIRNKVDNTELDMRMSIVAVLHNMTEMQVDSLNKSQFNKLEGEIAFIYSEVDSKPVKYIEVNGKRYKAIYDISKIPFGRYIESKVFSDDLIGNLHKLAATMFMPQKRTWYGKWVNDKYDASKHEEYASDMLMAKFKDVYGSLVFFYQVYRNWIEISKDYLANNLTNQGMTIEESKKAVHALCSILDGSIVPNLLPITKTLKYPKYMKEVQ